MTSEISVKALTKATLSILSPDEVFLVDYFDPRQSRPGSVAQGPQGFGASEAITLLLPVLYSFFSKYIEAVGTEAGKRTLGALVDWVAKKDPKREDEAKSEIRRTLVESGMRDESIDASVDAIFLILSKQG